MSTMRYGLAAALLLFGTAAMAAPSAKTPDSQPAVGVGMICNTPAQAERFLALRAHGTQAKSAMSTVNAEAKNPHACGIAAVAFIRDKTMASHPVGQSLLQVVRINVVAGFNGQAWQKVADKVQYAVIEAEGISI